MEITIVCDVLGKENNGTTIAAMNLIRYLKNKDTKLRFYVQTLIRLTKRIFMLFLVEILEKCLTHM